MRQVTEKAVAALMNGYNMKCGNTEVRNQAMYLFGHRIAWYENGRFYIQAVFQGVPKITNTTKERLNELKNVSVYHRNKVAHLNGLPWDGKKIEISL